MYKSSNGLSAQQLIDAISQDPVIRRQFQGVWPADMLPSGIRPGIYISNTANSTEPGRHWVTFFVPRNGPSEYFDSIGHSPDYYQEAFVNFLLRREPRYLMNNTRVQDYGSSTCGYYALFYALHRSYGHSMLDIVQLFDTNLFNNDIKVVNFARSYFSGF
jgi:hypothetical protein